MMVISILSFENRYKFSLIIQKNEILLIFFTGFLRRNGEQLNLRFLNHISLKNS